MKTESYNAKTKVMSRHVYSDFLLLPNFIFQMTNRCCDSLCRFQLLLGTEVIVFLQGHDLNIYSLVIKNYLQKSNHDEIQGQKPKEQ